ncbi:hypothetical protein ACFV1N_47995 [Streptosporangium canum]|uniref:hypothetical protein n=1 Tax=Streptosporangium canum TaxID=324952 RepID=UPI00369FFC3B
MIRIRHDLIIGTYVIEDGPLNGIGLTLPSAGFEWDARIEAWLLPDTAYLPADKETIASVESLLTKAGLRATVDIDRWTDPAEEAATARSIDPTGCQGYLITDLRRGDLVRYGEQLSTQTQWARVGRIHLRTIDVYRHDMLWSRSRISPASVQEARRTISQGELADLALHASARSRGQAFA